MPTEKKRLTYIPDLEALTVLGYDLNEDGQSACGQGPARRLARLVEQAARELDAVLNRQEWNAIADVLNGCADLYDYADVGAPALLMVRANLEDGDRLEGTGKKWKIDVPDLCRRLAALTPTHGEAILCACRWAWRHCDEWDHQKDQWWTPKFRKERKEAS